MRSARLRPLTMTQMMKGVAYCAVAFACIGPMVRLWQVGVVQGGSWEGLIALAIFEGVAVPLAWAGLTFVLVPREAGRDGWIAAFLLASVTTAEGFAWFVLVGIIGASWSEYRRFGMGPRAEVLSTLAVLGPVLVVLGAATWFLARRVLLALQGRNGSGSPIPSSPGKNPVSEPAETRN